MKLFYIYQDTTQFNYSHRKTKVEGLGKLRVAPEQGFFIHPTLAYSDEGLCLGIVTNKIIIRDEILGKGKRAQAKPIEDKESMRWLESYQGTQNEAQKNPGKIYINISDREGDFYELIEPYDAEIASNAHLLIRAKEGNRRIKDDGDGVTKLREKLKKKVVACSVRFDLSAISPRGQKNREQREIIQDIKFCEVTRGPPSKVKKFKTLKTEAKTTGILCSERDKTMQDPVEWLLLTTMPIVSAEDALKFVQYYILRWQIELYFKVFKSGCSIEDLQLENLDRIKNCLAFYMIVAWRVLFLTMIGRSCPSLSCELFYEQDEWEAAWQVAYRQKPPNTPPSINQINQLVAAFGGFLGRKRNPGIKVMWMGLQTLRHYTLSYISFKQSNTCG